MKRGIKSMITKKSLRRTNSGKTAAIKALSLAAFAGLALGAPMAIAADVDAQQTPTPNYEPKKLTPADLGTSDKITWTEVEKGTPGAIEIVTPAGTQYFKYETTTNPISPETPSIPSFLPGKSKNITWTKVPAGTEGAIEVKLSDSESMYYTYTVDKTKYNAVNPTNYNYNNVLFENIFNASNAGPVYNSDYETITNITGDFINNSTNMGGGAIGNLGTIDTINGDFISNYSGYGGAIYNRGSLGSITGDFVNNKAKGPISGLMGAGGGGAIFNYVGSKINNINGNFIANYAVYAGGAIYNYGCIGQIQGDFIGNSSGYVMLVQSQLSMVTLYVTQQVMRAVRFIIMAL